MESNQRENLMYIGEALLQVLGEDANREGLQETPRRFADFWMEFLHYDAGNSDMTFEMLTADQLVTVSGIEVVSICEHHLLPFLCTVSIAYITRKRVLGLSKFVRIAQQYAHKLQLQERLCQEIAETVVGLTGSPDVAVIASGVHMCMVMRGVKQHATMRTSVLLGSFREDHKVREELFSLLKVM